MKRSYLPSALAAFFCFSSLTPVFAEQAPITLNGQELSKWKEAESEHFIIYSDGDEKTLSKLSGRLEAIHYLLKIATNLQEKPDRPVVKVKVYSVGDIPDVARLIGDPQSNAAGYYDAQLAGPISVIPRKGGNGSALTSDRILFHEYGHHFMLQYQAKAYPAWYVEGFAEIISTASFEREGAITYGKPATHREGELRDTKRYPAAKMVDGRFLKEKGGENGWDYGDAWALAHYLTFSDKRKGQLGAYLKAINSGQSFAEAAKAFGDLNMLSRDLTVYVDGGSYPYKAPALPADVQKAPDIRTLTVAQAEFIEDKITMERLAQISTKEEHDEWAKSREKDGKPLKEDFDSYYAKENTKRTAWMTDLNARVARFANDPSAWVVKAHAECMADNFKDCQTSADKALSLQPDNWEAQLRKGQALIGLAKTAPEENRSALAKDGRKWSLKANASNPSAHEPLLYYYKSYGVEGKTAPANAIDSLAQVVATIPQIGSTRLMLGTELVARKDYGRAREVLIPLAYSPHESSQQKKALAMLELIEKTEGKVAAAAPVQGTE